MELSRNISYLYTVTNEDGEVEMEDATATEIAKAYYVTPQTVRRDAKCRAKMLDTYTVKRKPHKTCMRYSVTDIDTGEKVMTNATGREIADRFGMKSAGNIENYAYFGYKMFTHYRVTRDG